MPMVYYGNHRTIAIIILTKSGAIGHDTVVGEYGGQELTAAELVRYYDTDQLTTGNSNYRGLPWFDDGKVRSIVQNFDPELLFNTSRDGGKGVLLTQDGGKPFREMRGDYGYGIPVSEFVQSGG